MTNAPWTSSSMILWFWLLVGAVIASPITIEIKNAEEYNLPNTLIIGEIKTFVSTPQMTKIVSQLTTWKLEYFRQKNPQLEVKDITHAIGASFRSIRSKQFSYEEFHSDLFLSGDISKLVAHFVTMIKKDRLMSALWAKCKIYDFPFVRVSKRIEETRFTLELGNVNVKQFYEEQFQRMNSIEDAKNTVSQSSESESAGSPDMQLTEIYGVRLSKSTDQEKELNSFPTSNLRERLISRSEDVEDNRCCCTIS